MLRRSERRAGSVQAACRQRAGSVQAACEQVLQRGSTTFAPTLTASRRRRRRRPPRPHAASDMQPARRPARSRCGSGSAPCAAPASAASRPCSPRAPLRAPGPPQHRGARPGRRPNRRAEAGNAPRQSEPSKRRPTVYMMSVAFVLHKKKSVSAQGARLKVAWRVCRTYL